MIYKKRRLIDPKEIEFLTHEQRASQRTTIAELARMLMIMEEGQELPEADKETLQILTGGSTNPETWYNFVNKGYHETLEVYRSKLRRMGQHELAAYHEYMNPEMPPAKHHIWMCQRFEAVERGDTKTLLLSLSPGAAKPVDEQMLVLMGDGSRKALKDVVVGDNIIGKSGRPCRVEAVHVQGMLPCLEITTFSGRKLTLEKSHPILTASGWKEAGDIQNGDCLALMSKPAFSSDVDARELARCALAGYLCGDGCVTTSLNQWGSESISATVTCGDPKIAHHVLSIAHLAGFSGQIVKYQSKPTVDTVRLTTGVRPWLREIGLAGHDANTKFVPRFVFEAGVEGARAFLGSYMACDGSVYMKKGRYTTHAKVDAVSVSPQLAKDIQALMLRLGVSTTVRHRESNYIKKNGKACHPYRISARALHDVWVLDRELKHHWVGEKYERFSKFTGKADRIDQLYLADEVSTIHPVGDRACRCLTVSDDASFVASDIVVHNSTYGSRSFIQWCIGRNPHWKVLNCGHALALNTLIPTPIGFKNIVDLAVGDQVFAPDGTTTSVLSKSDIFHNHDCYIARTSDGAEITVDADHLWTVSIDGGPSQTYTAAQLVGEYYDARIELPRIQYGEYIPGDTPTDARFFEVRTLSFTPTASVPTQCITVDRADGLFLAGRGYIVTHNSQKFSDNEFSKPNRDTILTEDFHAVFPDVTLSETDRGADYWVIDQHGGKYYSKGAGAGISGIRALLTNLDDPIRSAKDASSALIRGDLWNWMTSDILARRLPGARLVVTSTRWHSEDIIGRMEETYKTKPDAIMGPVEIINIPAQAEENDILGRQPGEWLWEEFYGKQHYESLRLTMAPGMWAALYCGKPLDKFGTFVAEDQFKRYVKSPSNNKDTGIRGIKKTVISVDTAQKGSERSNFTAIMVFRQGIDGFHYLVHAIRVKSIMTDVVQLLNRLAMNWEADYFLIEDAGFGSQIIQNYQGKLAAPIVQYAAYSKSSKDFQFENAVTYISSGLVLFPEQAVWLTDVINEFVGYPDGKYDDYIDAFSQYTDHAMKARRGGTKKMKMGY